MSSIQKRPNGRWRARYRGPDGREHSKHFSRKADAERYLKEIEASIVTGLYVDPRAGRITVREFAEDWRLRQVHRESTAEHYETTLRRHVYPRLGDLPISQVRPSHIQGWVKATSQQLAPSTVGVAHGILSSMFAAAVADRRITANPCIGTKLPTVVKARIVPLTTAEVEALREGIPERYRALVILAAGSGLRPGECFGLTADRIDFLRREVRVDRQLVLRRRMGPDFGPPKTPASYRTIPLPQVVIEALAAHMAQFPTGLRGLVFTTEDGQPIRRTMFSDKVWQPTVRRAGVRLGTRLHDLRHYYASLLIAHNVSVKIVQARLGHASASETLDTYAHLWPDSDDLTREAIDSVLGRGADSPRTAETDSA